MHKQWVKNSSNAMFPFLDLLLIPYSIKFLWGKILENRSIYISFQSFGEENVGGFTKANISFFSESEIWLGKILVNNVHYAKFAKVFPPVLYD